MDEKKKAKGFSMIELMIVVLIISILSAYASFAYRNFIVKAKMSEVISIATIQKRNIIEYYATHNEFPSGYGLTRTDPDFITWARVVQPSGNPNKITILIQLNKDLMPGTHENPHFQMQGIIQADRTVEWTCGSRDWWRKIIPHKYMPTSCQDRNGSPWN